MGWWGVNVMEGDPPMDAECDIIDILAGLMPAVEGPPLPDMDNDDEDDFDSACVALLSQDGIASKVLAKILEHEEDWDRNITMQVLGEIIVCNGFTMPDDVREAAVKAATEDEWAQEDDERKEAMEVYAKRIAEYNGTALEPVSMGLFAKFSEALEAGEKGLINKR